MRHTAKDSRCQNAALTEMLHLVFHQGYEGRYNDTYTLKCQSWHLESQRLAATRWHESQRIVA